MKIRLIIINFFLNNSKKTLIEFEKRLYLFLMLIIYIFKMLYLLHRLIYGFLKSFILLLKLRYLYHLFRIHLI